MFGDGFLFYLGDHSLQGRKDVLVGLVIKVFGDVGVPQHDTLVDVPLFPFGLLGQEDTVAPLVLGILLFCHKPLCNEGLDDPRCRRLVDIEVGGELFLGLSLCMVEGKQERVLCACQRELLQGLVGKYLALPMQDGNEAANALLFHRI